MIAYMLQYLRMFQHDEKGQAMTEYGLIIALVALAVILALGFMGDQINAIFESITTSLTEATPT